MVQCFRKIIKIKLRFFLLPFISCFGINSIAHASNEMSEQQIIARMNASIERLNIGNSPWSEFNIKANPIIVTFANQHNYAYFFSPKNPNWVKISDQPTTFYLNNDEYKIDQLAWSFGNIVDGQAVLIFT